MQHLLFSVVDPQFRAKPAGVSDVSLLAFPYAIFLLLIFSLFVWVLSVLLLLSLGDSLHL